MFARVLREITVAVRTGDRWEAIITGDSTTVLSDSALGLFSGAMTIVSKYVETTPDVETNCTQTVLSVCEFADVSSCQVTDSVGFNTRALRKLA